MNLSIAGFTGVIASQYIPVLNAIVAPDGLKLLALAHTTIEGFFPGSKAYRTNNPGNIGTSRIANSTGAYPTLKEGTQAQLNQINLILTGKSKYYKPDSTLKQYIYTYAPPAENNSEAYLNHVITTFKKQGIVITGETKLRDIATLGGDQKKK